MITIGGKKTATAQQIGSYTGSSRSTTLWTITKISQETIQMNYGFLKTMPIHYISKEIRNATVPTMIEFINIIIKG